VAQFRLLKRTRQVTECSCGASALQSVLSYWGRDVDETELMKLLHTTPEAGTYPEDIVAGARALGFLDLHSAPIAQELFMVAEQAAVDFFSKLGIPRIMTGWGKVSSGAIGGDAENYANAHGAKSATLESGSHCEKRSNDVAYQSIVSLLSLLGMIAGTEQKAARPLEIVDVYAVVTKEADDFRYAGKVDNFQFIKKGKSFGFQSGRAITVSEDSYLLIPMKPQDTRIHEEVCYLGRKVDAA